MSALSDALHEANVENWSARDIARRGDDRVHFATIAKYMGGRHGRPSEDVLEVFSEVLRIPMPQLRQLAGLPAGDQEPYEPPREANRLDRRQRKLVDELIRMLVEAKVGDGNAGRDATSIGAGRLTFSVGAGTGKTEVFLQALLARSLEQQLEGTPVDVDRPTIELAVSNAVDLAFGDIDTELYEDLAARLNTD